MEEPRTEPAEPAAYADYGTFEADCPARMGTELFANTWLPIVVYVLRDGPMRPGDLRKTIAGISQKMLTQTLRRMERMSLVERRRYAEAPPRVEYGLTPAGRDLLVPIFALGRWADRHGAAVAAAMEAADAAGDAAEWVGQIASNASDAPTRLTASLPEEAEALG